MTHWRQEEERMKITLQCYEDATLLARREIFVFISVEMNLLAYKL